MRSLINEGPFQAVNRDGTWLILDGVGAAVATVHGEWAYHDAPILAERMSVAWDIVALREKNEELEGRAEDAESDCYDAECDLRSAQRDLAAAELDIAKLRSQVAS